MLTKEVSAVLRISENVFLFLILRRCGAQTCFDLVSRKPYKSCLVEIVDDLAVEPPRLYPQAGKEIVLLDLGSNHLGQEVLHNLK